MQKALNLRVQNEANRGQGPLGTAFQATVGAGVSTSEAVPAGERMGAHCG